MAAWTLDEAKAKLAIWLAAEEKTAQGLSTQLGDRRLTRNDADMVRRQVSFWRQEVDRLENPTRKTFQTIRTRFAL